MATEIQINLDAKAQEILTSPNGVPARVFTAIKGAMNQEMELISSVIVEKRMSFPRKGKTTLEGLRVNTGRLRRSMMRGGADTASRPAEQDGLNITGAVGTNVRYAAIHEYGGTFNRPLRATSREFRQKFRFGGKTVSRTSVRIGFQRSHTATYPARRPIGRTVDERRQQFVQAVSAAIVGAMKE